MVVGSIELVADSGLPSTTNTSIITHKRTKSQPIICGWRLFFHQFNQSFKHPVLLVQFVVLAWYGVFILKSLQAYQPNDEAYILSAVALHLYNYIEQSFAPS